MYMPYTNNPNLPKVRREAIKLISSGWSQNQVSKYLGYQQGTISKWVKKASFDKRKVIPTLSSRPHHHPLALPDMIVDRILNIRQERNQCAEIIHHRLKREGIIVSLSSVKRTLRRNGISKYSKWKKWHVYPERPKPEKPGILVEIDTIHTVRNQSRLYLYTILDVCSRYAFAYPVQRINTHQSLRFILKANDNSPFSFQTIQSDHGSEFSKWFTKRIIQQGLSHRHSRIRTPNDNAHLERFNRTIQEECLSQIPRSLESWAREIPRYLRYYNYERPHMGLEMKTPIDIIKTIPSY